MKKLATYKNYQIAYQIEGKGATLVLLHGFGEDNRIWRKVYASLVNAYQVISIDTPGTGGSTLFKDSEASLEEYAKSFLQVLDQENIGQAVILGHSMGGYITLAFAELFPDRLKGFGLLHSTAFADSEEKKEVRSRGIQLMKEYGAFSFLKTTLPNLFAPENRQSSNTDLAEQIEWAEALDTDACIQYYAVMRERIDRSQILAQANVPILFILGLHDVAAPYNDLLQQVNLPAIAHVTLLHNTGHMGMLEEVEPFLQGIYNYMNSITK